MSALNRPTAAAGDVVAALVPDLAPGQTFGHREHLRLAWTALVAYGSTDGEETVCTLVRLAISAVGAADRYHETTTRFWCRQIANHLGEDEDFDAFHRRTPHLHDKRLVKQYYSQALLDTPDAFSGWVEPDLLPLIPNDLRDG